MKFQLNKFAGDLSSGAAAWYDFGAISFYWLIFGLVRIGLTGTPWSEWLPMIFWFGAFSFIVMVGFMSVWTVRPLIAALLACIVSVLAGEYSFAGVAAVASVVAIVTRALNHQRALAPHPSLQHDRARPACYEDVE